MKKIILTLFLFFPFQLVYSVEDYAQLRMEFAAQENFDSFSLLTLEKGLLIDANAEWRDGKGMHAIEKLNELVDLYPFSIQGHVRLSNAYQELRTLVEEPELLEMTAFLEKKHHDIAIAIIESILNSGDGRSANTAYKVITIIEEYQVLLYLGLEATKRHSQHSQRGTGSEIFDVFDVIDEKEKSRKVYFELLKS